jgi:hypothetical protein
MDYWKKHKRAPGKIHTPDLVADILEDPNNARAEAYRSVLVGMVWQTDNDVNAAHVLDQVNIFLKLHKRKGAVLKAAETLESQ